MDEGITVDELAVALTRPAGKWGVSWVAFVLNILIAAEVFIWTHNLLWLLLVFPVHGVFYVACLHDPRIFDLALVWGKTKGYALHRNFTHWACSSYSPLTMRKQPSSKSKRKFRRMNRG